MITKFYWAILAMIVAMSALWYGIGWNDAQGDTQKPSLPICDLEDGYTEMKACLWDDGTGDVVINMDQGRYSFNLTTGKLTDWSK